MLKSFWLWDLSEGPLEIEIIVEKVKTQMDNTNSKGSPGPDGVHPGVSKEPEDETDKQWVINCYKTVLICKYKNRVSLENKIKWSQGKYAKGIGCKCDAAHGQLVKALIKDRMNRNLNKHDLLEKRQCVFSKRQCLKNLLGFSLLDFSRNLD